MYDVKFLADLGHLTANVSLPAEGTLSMLRSCGDRLVSIVQLNGLPSVYSVLIGCSR